MKLKTDRRNFVNNILFDVYSDFEKTLEHATTHSDRRLKDSKFSVSISFGE